MSDETAPGRRQPSSTRPPRAPKSIPREYLTRRYLLDGQSATQIAEETGWSSQYVRDRLRDYGIPLRPPGVAGDKPQLDQLTLQGWIDAGLTIRQIADRAGYSTSGVRKVMDRCGMAVPERVRPPLAGQRLLEELADRYTAGMSLLDLAKEHGHTADWVKARLAEAGVKLRPPGRQSALKPELVRAGLDEGLRTAEIAQQVGFSEWAVLKAMRDHGWSPPPRRSRGPVVDLPLPPEPVLRRLHDEQGLTVADISKALDLPRYRVLTAMKKYGISRRRPGWTDGAPPAPISREQLEELYVSQGLNLGDTAAALDTTQVRIRKALHRFEIPVRSERRGPPPPVPIDTNRLHELYVVQRLDDEAIGQLVGVPALRIRLRREELGVKRPRLGAPRPALSITPEHLRVLYVDQGRTLVQIGKALGVAPPTVRAWLVDAGIPVQPRTTRETRTSLDPVQLRDLYVERLWNAVEIGAHLDVAPAQVRRALHAHNIPVRRGPSRRQPDDHAAVLTSLYDDPDIRALLRNHRIPQRRVTGGIADRFPTPIPLTEEFLRAAYEDLGLATQHIEMLTGQPADQVGDEMRQHGIELRGSGLSPWRLRKLREG